MKFNSDFYGRNLTEEVAFAHVVEHTKNGKWEIIVGTDSQQRKDKLKIVTVIALVERGAGGGRIIFSTWDKIPMPHHLSGKIYEEARRSIDVGDKLLLYLIGNLTDEEYEARKGSGMGIHIDIGEKGKTSRLIKEIVGYITGAGYKATIKPDSYVASVIADRLTKK